MGRVTSLSWNRSVLSPYLLSAGGTDGLLWNHDVRMRNSLVCLHRLHRGEIINLQWSTNTSHELMRSSDPSNIYLASTSVTPDLACWRLCDLNYQSGHSIDVTKPSIPHFYEDEVFSSGGAVKALAWCPSQEGVLATGGGAGDQIIRLFDIKRGCL